MEGAVGDVSGPSADASRTSGDVSAPGGADSGISAFFELISPAGREADDGDCVLSDELLLCILHRYQRQTVGWAVRREQLGADAHGVCGGIIAEEMGLGKSVEVMALVLSHQPPDAPPLALALDGGCHPARPARTLLPRSAPSSPQLLQCGVCGYRLQPSEPCNLASGTAHTWACCMWCFLQHQPKGAERERDSRVAPPQQLQQQQARRVRFAGDAEEEHMVEQNGARPAPPAPAAAASAAAEAPRSSPLDTPLPYARVRLKRPRPPSELESRPESRLEERIAARPPIGCTLIVTPAPIHRQWLDELHRHCPALAARTLVYPGLHQLEARDRLGGTARGQAGTDRHGSAARLAAWMEGMERAWVVLTTYKVLKQEVHFLDSAGEEAGGRFRQKKRYAVPRSPLLLRTFWRLVIDEAQAVRIRSSTPSQLAAMSMRIAATHRWCVTGTPLSPEAGLIDALDLLGFLGCGARDAADGGGGGGGGGDGGGGGGGDDDDASELLPTSRAVLARATVEERLRMLLPMRDMMWRTSKAYAHAQLRIPPPRLHRLPFALSAAEHAWAVRDVVELGGSADELGGSADELAPVAEAARPVRYELQRALTHAQLSRGWLALGRSEAQIETGTSVVDLELLQRAAELTMRRKQLCELELCERLNALGACHGLLGETGEARAAYERVGRIYEWGILENEGAGHQVDNAEETLRRWGHERIHALFRLLCMHYDEGRAAEAEAASADLQRAQSDLEEECRATATKRAYAHSASVGALLEACALMARLAEGAGPSDDDAVDGGAGFDGFIECVRHARSVEEQLATPWLVCAARASDGGGGIAAERRPPPRPPACWSRRAIGPPDAYVRRLSRLVLEARERARRSLRGEGGAEAGQPDGRDDAARRAGDESAEEADAEVGAEQQQQQQQQQQREAPRLRPGRGRGVVDFWEVSEAEEQRLSREKAARAAAYRRLTSSGAIGALDQGERLEEEAQVEGECEALRREAKRLRLARRECVNSRSIQAEAATDGPRDGADGAAAALAYIDAAQALVHGAQQEATARLGWSFALRDVDDFMVRVEECKGARAPPERVVAAAEAEAEAEAELRAREAAAAEAAGAAAEAAEAVSEPVHLATLLKRPAVERAVRAEARAVQLAIERLGEACHELERQAAAIYGLRLTECRADRRSRLADPHPISPSIRIVRLRGLAIPV